MVKYSPDRKIWLGSNLNTFADNLALGQIIRFVCAERKQAISPLPAMFSLAFCLTAIKKEG